MDVNRTTIANKKIDTICVRLLELVDIYRQEHGMSLFLNLIRMYRSYTSVDWNVVCQKYEKIVDDRDDGIIDEYAFKTAKTVLNALLPLNLNCDDYGVFNFDFEYNLSVPDKRGFSKLRRVLGQKALLTECNDFVFSNNMIGTVKKMLNYLHFQQLRRLN